MKVLITGGLGVIGSIAAHRFIEAGDQVLVIDAAEEPRNEWIAKTLEDKATVLRGRLEDHGDHLDEILAEADAVVHAAAHTGIPHSVVDPADDWRSNVDATKVLLDALRKHPRPTVVLSSIKPYRVLPLPAAGLTEIAVLEPDEPYAASKAAQSMLCQAYARSYGIPVTTFRCSNLYGPAPSHGPRHGWLTWFCIAAAIGRDIEVQGGGEQTRDMLHADDVYRACRAAFASLMPAASFQVAGEIFNLGGGINNRISVGEAAAIVAAKTGANIIYAPPRPMDDAHVFVNCEKFMHATGWAPAVEVTLGIAQLVAWARANRADLEKMYAGV